MLGITCRRTQNPKTRETRRIVAEIETEMTTETEERTEIGSETTETETGTGEIGAEIEIAMVIETETGMATERGGRIGRGSPTLRNQWRRSVLLPHWSIVHSLDTHWSIVHCSLDIHWSIVHCNIVALVIHWGIVHSNLVATNSLIEYSLDDIISFL